MYKDKDTNAMEELMNEHYTGYALYSNKPITRTINLKAKVTITRTAKGWQVEIFDPTVNHMIPADEFISDMVLKEYTEDIEIFKKEQARRETSERARGELKNIPMGEV